MFVRKQFDKKLSSFGMYVGIFIIPQGGKVYEAQVFDAPLQVSDFVVKADGADGRPGRDGHRGTIIIFTKCKKLNF